MPDAVTRLNAALEGRYTIERELGEGGMATVYLARDQKHNRNVALKVLKPELAAVVGAERFLAEIETTATLHHPHILPLFDSGEADGFLFYVMPYTEGETLKERIDREKQLPVDEAVRVSTAVAQALQHAHDRGVIHRDIKPANILLQDGQPLVSDFGIALAVGSAGGARLTETGLSVGTPYYMSPEQATGDQHVGPTSDVYALGAVLYEMLTGDPPYMGSTAQAVLGQIIAGASVSATAKRRAVPTHVDAALRKALEKIPADRFASAQDFGRALADPGFRYGVEEAGPAAAGAGPWKAATAVLTAVALATTGLAAGSLFQAEEPGVVRRYELTFPEGEAPVPGTLIRFMPDGGGLMYVGSSGPVLRPWDALEASRAAEAGGAAIFAPSPDGREVALVGPDAGLQTISLAGGPRRTLDVGPAIGAWDWAADGYIYFTPVPAGADPAALHRVLGDGSADAEALTTVEEGDFVHLSARVLPGGRLAIFNTADARSLLTGAEVWAVDLDTREAWFVTRGSQPAYAETGQLLYATPDGVLMAAPFDAGSGEITGPELPIAEGLFPGALGNYTFDVSPEGTLVYEEAVGEIGDGAGAMEPIWVSRTGEAEVIDPAWTFSMAGVGETGVSGWALSPDGSRVAVSRMTEGVVDIWVKQLPSGPFDRLTQTQDVDASPFWFSDGQFVGFTAQVTANLETEVWRRRADGSGSPEPWLQADRRGGLGYVQVRVSRDEEWVVGRTFGPSGPGRDIFAFRVDSDGSAVPLAVSPQFQEHGPDLSPEGTLLAYSSDESGREEVYIRPFPDFDSGRLPVSLAGGSNPKWAHNGREIFFIDAERRMNVAEIEWTPTPRVARREVLFTLAPTWFGGTASMADGGDDIFDVDVDDQRFLMGRLQGGGEPGGVSRFIVVENWLEEFRGQLER